MHEYLILRVGRDGRYRHGSAETLGAAVDRFSTIENIEKIGDAFWEVTGRMSDGSPATHWEIQRINLI
jgi:hypothetical protein